MSEIQAINFDAMARQFDDAAVRAIALMGSHARDDAGPYSDVDLVRFVEEGTGDLADSGSHLIDGALVVVSNVEPATVETWFTQPQEAVKTIGGLRQARALIDRGGTFAAIQARAHEFIWTPALQATANAWASEQMMGWIEEAHKGLEGLRRYDVGRLLNGLHGLTWGLTWVMQVQRGVLLSGDNNFYDEVATAMGQDSLWTNVRAVAFGVSDVHGRPPSLRERVVAGLGLYVLTVEALGEAIQPEHTRLIDETVRLINARLEGAYHGE